MNRSYHSKEVFFDRMKKKPALQAILDKLDSYTEEELASLPGQPLWIREILVKRRKRGGVTPEMMAEKIADMMEVAPGMGDNSENRVFQVKIWQGNMIVVGQNVNAKFDIELDMNEPFLLIEEDHQIKIGSMLVKVYDHVWPLLLKSSREVGWMDNKDYYWKVHQPYLNQKHKIQPEQYFTTPESVQVAPPDKPYGINPNRIDRVPIRKTKE